MPWALTLFAYWVLTSIAGYKALGQLVRNPFYWEKTQHGISAQTKDQLTGATETVQSAEPTPRPPA